MITKTQSELYDIVEKILTAAGADSDNAAITARHLVLANLSGVDTHGVWHVSGYVDAIKKEELLATAKPEIVGGSGSSILVSGNWTFGQVLGQFATERVIELADKHGIAVAGMVRCHHLGRLGHYPEMAAEAGMISMVWAGGFGEVKPAATPFGGRERWLHTNPVSMGFPSGSETTTMFDFATTAISGVKVDNARRRGEPLPPGCIVDRDGNPSTNAEDFFSGGGHLPFGSHKGYALMTAAEIMGRVYTGSDDYVDSNRAGPVLRHQGATIVVMKADLFQDMSNYQRRADELQQRTRSIAPATGIENVMVPGDPEVRSRAEREQNGIPIEDHIWEGIVATAQSLGLGDV